MWDKIMLLSPVYVEKIQEIARKILQEIYLKAQISRFLWGILGKLAKTQLNWLFLLCIWLIYNFRWNGSLALWRKLLSLLSFELAKFRWEDYQCFEQGLPEFFWKRNSLLTYPVLFVTCKFGSECICTSFGFFPPDFF